MPKNALLLAAGLGMRLRPLTDVLPKCLVPIRGRPLLEYWLHALAKSGFERIVINTHHHADLIESYITRGPWAPRVMIFREATLLGTAGTLVANAEIFRGGPLFVAHADNLSAFSLAAFRAAHAVRPPAAALTMMTFKTDSPSSCGIVTTDPAGLVSGFYEKVPDPPGDRANAAVYIFEQEVLEHACKLHKAPLDLSTEVLPQFLGRMWTWHNSVYHRDVGTISSWRAAQRDYPWPPPEPPDPDPWPYVLDEAFGAKATIAQLLESA